MDMTQQLLGDQMESGHRKLDYGTPTDDEEVTLPPHDRATEVPDFPDTDIMTDHLWKPQGVQMAGSRTLCCHRDDIS